MISWVMTKKYIATAVFTLILSMIGNLRILKTASRAILVPVELLRIPRGTRGNK